MIQKLKFTFNLFLKFSDLNDFDKKIKEKINETSFDNLNFDVYKIINYQIKETIVSDFNIICKMLLFVECFFPEVGKTFCIETKNFVPSKVSNNKYLFVKGKVHILCESKFDIFSRETVKIIITENKVFYKHILCLSESLEE